MKGQGREKIFLNDRTFLFFRYNLSSKMTILSKVGLSHEDKTWFSLPSYQKKNVLASICQEPACLKLEAETEAEEDCSMALSPSLMLTMPKESSVQIEKVSLCVVKVSRMGVGRKLKVVFLLHTFTIRFFLLFYYL